MAPGETIITQAGGKLTAGWFVVDAVAVENKRLVRSVDADGRWPVFEQSQLQGLGVARCDVRVALDLRSELGGVHVAESVLLKGEKKITGLLFERRKFMQC